MGLQVVKTGLRVVKIGLRVTEGVELLEEEAMNDRPQVLFQ